METAKPGRKVEKPHPEWREGDRLPLNPLAMEQIASMNLAESYQRLQEFHNISPAAVFRRKPEGRKWGELSLLHLLLGRLEGHSSSDVFFALQDESGLEPDTQESTLQALLRYYCNDTIYQRTRSNAAAYQTLTFKSRDPEFNIEVHRRYVKSNVSSIWHRRSGGTLVRSSGTSI